MKYIILICFLFFSASCLAQATLINPIDTFYLPATSWNVERVSFDSTRVTETKGFVEYYVANGDTLKTIIDPAKKILYETLVYGSEPAYKEYEGMIFPVMMYGWQVKSSKEYILIGDSYLPENALYKFIPIDQTVNK